MRLFLLTTLLASALPLSAASTYVVLNASGTVVRVPGDGSAVTQTINGSGGAGVAIDSSGNYIIATGGASLISLTQAGGATTLATSPGGTLADVTIDSSGNYIVVDVSKHQLLKVTGAAPHTVSVIATYPIVNNPVCNTATTPTCEAAVVRIDAAGNYILIEDNGGSVHLFRITPAGALSTVSITGVAPAGAGGLGFDANGNYIIVDYRNGAVDTVTPAGAATTLIQNATLQTANIGAIVRDPATGNYIVAGFSSNSLFSIPANGANFTQFAANSLIAQPLGLAIITPASAPSVPSQVSSSPSSGSGNSSTFTFTFADTGGFQNLHVVDILINNALDGRRACYIAFVPSSASTGSLFLVDDAGDSGGPYQGATIPGNGSAGNSQCTVTPVSVQGTGNNLTLTLNISFSAAFAGNRIIYMSAGENIANSGWQALVTWNIPGPVPTGPSVTGLAQGRLTGLSQTYTFTFNDTKGWQDISVANVLINSAIDGRIACYVAYVPSGAASGTLYLVDNAGDAGGPYTSTAIPSNGTASNSQCTVGTSATTASGSNNTLILTLQVNFTTAFAGNQIIFAAARSATASSDWQAVGTVVVPKP